jgi:RNA polymerase sigma-70 factor (ECF subfamily)
MFNFFKSGKQKSGADKTGNITNEQWMAALSPPPEELFVEKLRKHLVLGLKPALSRYVDRELHDFVEDTAQDSIILILQKIDSFRGESRFTTWALKIAVRQGLTELRRKKWQDVSLDRPAGVDDESQTGMAESYMNDASKQDPDPSQLTHEQMMLNKVMKMMNEVLTEKQRLAITNLMIKEMPIVVVAEKMNIKQNALYKLVHDARLKLKKKLESEGMNLEDLYAQR